MQPSNEDRLSTIGRAMTLGVASGLRSQVPLMLLAHAAKRGEFAVGAEPPLGWLRSRRLRQALDLSAVGEMIGDKLPFVPKRTDPAPLLGRIVIGALAGAALLADGRQPWLDGAIAGAAGGAAGTFGGRYARAMLVAWTGLPDPVVALVEDGLAIGIGLVALRRNGSGAIPAGAPSPDVQPAG
ncbi:MAG: DUF4126 family protein [Thermomicrobiales bacterium]